MRDVNRFRSILFGSLSLASVILMALGSTAHALRMTVMPKENQTTRSDPQLRQISIKLPLTQPVFHWTFMSKKKFLAGKLVLRIIRENKTTEIVIFDDGFLSEGWMPTNFPNPEAGEIYFGFESSKKYATAPGDVLEIELLVKEDLDGIGAFQTGTLPKGTYWTRGTYSGLIDEYKIAGDILVELPKESLDNLKKAYEFKAFLENWDEQWTLNISGEDGWLSPEERQLTERFIEQMEQEDNANKNN